MVVLALIMLKLNLDIIPMQIIYVRIKENSIPTCQTGPFALGHVENFSWDPSYKRFGGVGKIWGGYFKNWWLILIFNFNSFQCYLFLSVWFVCIYLFTLLLSISLVFHWKNLVLLHLINRCMTSTSNF